MCQYCDSHFGVNIVARFHSLSADEVTLLKAQGGVEVDLNREWQLLSSRVCLYLSDVSLRCGRHLDAMHFARLATQVEPGSNVCSDGHCIRVVR